MTGGTRMPSWKERENNKCRERRRRAFAAKIFAGLRLYGKYTLPKHCDNNEVLKALCNEAGWTVEPDGTTYRKGFKPVENMDIRGGSASASASGCSSYQQSPCTSYHPSPANGNSLIPWLRNLSSSTSSASSSKFIHHYMHGGSISAPVTPPSSSPTARTPRINTDLDGSFAHLGWGPFLPLSTPPSPGRQILPDSKWYVGTQVPQSGSTSPTFSLVSSNPFGFKMQDLTRSGSLMCTPGQSGTCSPVVADTADIPMSQVIPNEFAFGSNATSLVKPWEGEMIHEECGSDDLELTLGSSKSRYITFTDSLKDQKNTLKS